jgi:hypothetical protein
MARRGDKKATVVGGKFTDTVGVQYSSFSERFVPGWDKEMAAGQEMAHVKWNFDT